MISYHWIDATLVLNWVKIQWRRIINEKKNKKRINHVYNYCL